MNRNEIKKLSAESRSGNKDAFERLYNEFRDKVFFFAMRYVGNEASAEDITSETFALALEHITELRSDDSFVGWLYSIAYNCALKSLKENSHRESFEISNELDKLSRGKVLSEPLMLPEDYAINKQTQEQLKAIIDSLSPDLRSAIILYYYEGMTVSEVANSIGTNENNTKQKLHKARAVIRKKVEKLVSRGAVLSAVPFEVLMHNSFDASYTKACATGAAWVAEKSLALRVALTGIAAVVAVGVPVTIKSLKISGSGGDYRPEDISVAVDDTNEVFRTDIEVLSYKDGMMTFLYNGRQYTLPFSKTDFENDNRYCNFGKSCLSECIIDNKIGEKVIARVSLDKNITKMLRCDVVTPNGFILYKRIESNIFSGGIKYDTAYTFRRTEGTGFEIYNSKESLRFDINDFDPYYKVDYPETVYPVEFSYYNFFDGGAIPLLLTNVEYEEDDSGYTTKYPYEFQLLFRGRMCFFGKIVSVNSDNTVTVLLNDKKTYCTVPTYFNDGGKLKTDVQVMIVLYADSTLYGSGGNNKYDYAVISTDESYYNTTGDESYYNTTGSIGKNVNQKFYQPTRYSFDELAYASFNSDYSLEYTSVSMADYLREYNGVN